MPRPDSSNGDYHAGPNGDGSSNGSGGNGSPARPDVLTYRPARPRAQGDPRYSYRGLSWLSGIILAMCVAMAGGMLIAWGRDPVVQTLLLLFLSATVAIAGAVAGIVLVPLGLSRKRPGLWVTGLIVGVISFAAMIAAIGWAMRAEWIAGR